MPYAHDGRLPVIYVRGFAGGRSGIDTAVNDPFYGFNEGAVQARVDGRDRPLFHQFESPLLRLLIDHGYDLLVRGNQAAYLADQEPGSVPAASIWVHRFYDEFAPRLTRDPNPFRIESAAQDLLDLVLLVLRQTGAPRVFLVAHSMGGLVVRSMLQRFAPDDARIGGSLDAAAAIVDRVFTYATPHGGIEFAVGHGVLEALRDLTGVAGADVFGPDRMYEYLTPQRVPGAAPRDAFDATVVPEGGFPLDRFFCLVGTDAQDYAVGLGIPARVVGDRSDGLVQIDNAAIVGAPRAVVHRSHSGPYGIVNSEEGYQSLQRFLFGDLQVTADLVDVRLPGSADDETDWQLDVQLSVRGLPVVLHEQSAAHLCPVQIERPKVADTPGRPVPLVRTFLSSSATRPTDASGARAATMRYVLVLRLASVKTRHGVLWFADHLERTADWADALVVDIGEVDGRAQVWATWNSQIDTAIADWAPRPGIDAPLADEEPAPDHWRVRVPVPQVARRLLGDAASVTLDVVPRSTVDLA